MVIFAALALWFTLLIAPDTTIGRLIHRWTVAKPAARLNRITRGQVLLTLLVVSGASFVGWLIGHEAVRLLAMGLPEFATWATMFEVTAYLDALAAIVTAASVTRFGTVKTWARPLLTARRPRSREVRGRSAARTPANDDEDSRAGFAWAA